MKNFFTIVILSFMTSVSLATGKVTIGIPSSFPGKEKAVVIAPDKLKWPGRGQSALSRRDEFTRNNSNKRSRSMFTKQVEVFGLHVYATNTTDDDKLLHAANILAEYIDNNEDGIPDNPKVMKALIEGKGAIVMRKTEGERTTGPRPRGQVFNGDKGITVIKPPKELDYDFWLGPAPYSAYVPARVHWNWRC